MDECAAYCDSFQGPRVEPEGIAAMTTSYQAQIARFRALHAPGSILVLPNVWDAASARVAEECGAKAIATSSASLAWAHGYPDGQQLPRETLIAVTAEIARTVNLPISVDSEAGFSSAPDGVAGFVSALVHAGAAGINLEDGTTPPALLAAKITAIKKSCRAEGWDVFVNARVDVYLRALVPAEKAVEESIARGRLYRDAGADGLFVPGVTDLGAMRAISEAVDLPLNVLVRPGLASVAELQKAGVRRVSAGSDTSRAALGAYRRAAKELLEQGRYDTLYAEADGCPGMNALLKRG
jgi:2-methylisocitrate lyase-like PEP mutase family enzyme